jgi:uncharacterized heparinase superfamily protein
MAKPEREIVLEKCPTGIRGFDEISNGGLPDNAATNFLLSIEVRFH